MHVDGRKLTPQKFFTHDFGHARYELMYSNLSGHNNKHEFTLESLRGFYLEYRKTLAPKERWLFEFSYFIFSHETNTLLVILFSGLADMGEHERLSYAVRIRSNSDLKAIVPAHASANRRSARKYLSAAEASMQKFVDAFFSTSSD